MIDDEIRALLDAPAAGAGAPTLAAIEHTLTAGYAEALTLEAERWRIERRIAEVATGIGEGTGSTSELTALGRRLSNADSELGHLRELLGSLRERAAAARAA